MKIKVVIQINLIKNMTEILNVLQFYFKSTIYIKTFLIISIKIAIVFAQQTRGAIKTVFIRVIEARLVFIDAFIFAEKRLKTSQYFQGIQSLNCHKCSMTSLNLKNLIGVD